jgi:hypothetical protein
VLRWLAVFAALALLALPARARADRGVLVLGTAAQPARDGLVEAVQIQLAGIQPVAIGGPLSAATPELRQREAVTLVARERALVAVWCEPAGEREHCGFACRAGRRVHVEVLQLTSGDRRQHDRTVALMVRSLVESSCAHRAALPRRDGADAQPPPPQPAAEVAGAPDVGGAVLFEAGGFGATGAGSAGVQAGGLFGVGARLELGAWAGELIAHVRPASALTAKGERGEVSATEVGAGGSLRMLHGWPGVAVGVGVGAGARLLAVDGTGSSGERGEAHPAVPVVRFGPELRWVATDWLELRLAGTLEIATVRVELSGNGETLLDLGRARGVSELTLVATVP